MAEVTQADRAARQRWYDQTSSDLSNDQLAEIDQLLARHRTEAVKPLVEAEKRADILAIALTEAVRLIDEINERATSREFHGIDQALHAKLCTVRATLCRAALRSAQQ